MRTIAIAAVFAAGFGVGIGAAGPTHQATSVPADRVTGIDYGVRNREALLTQLRSAGVTVDGKVVEDFNGKFAWVVDREGHKFELSEPMPEY